MDIEDKKLPILGVLVAREENTHHAIPRDVARFAVSGAN